MMGEKKPADNNQVSMFLRVDRQCLLTGAPESVREAIRQRLTIKNPKYDAAVRYGRWVGKGLQPKLYFFQERGPELIFPRGFANQAVLLCRQLAGISPEIVDMRRRLESLSLTFTGKLRPYQKEAVRAMLAHSFGVLDAGTGSGKTVMALKIIAERRQPALVLVHSRELLDQWRDRVARFLDIHAGQVGGGCFDPRPVTVGIVNTVRRRLDELAPLFGHLIVDECHRVPASLFTDVVSAFDCWYMLGLSATAFRREDGMTRIIYTYMGDRVHKVDQGKLVESGAVIRPEYVQHRTSFTYGYRGEYTKLLKALTQDGKRNEQIVDDVVRLFERPHQGTVLIVSDRVAHCRLLKEKLAGHGFDADLLTGRCHPEERQRIVQGVQKGRVQILISTLQLIGEGFDCPGLATIFLATPIQFEGRILQVIGRVMRPAKGKKALVIDYDDHLVPVLRRSAQKRRLLFARLATP
jgi:superfamily II DNA or RNA helicase